MSTDVATSDRLSLDVLSCPAATVELPALATAMDPDAMCERLGEALLAGGAALQHVKLAQAMYEPGRACTVRYLVDVVAEPGAPPAEVLVGARIFRSRQACDRWYRTALAPLGARLAGRVEAVPPIHPVGVIPELQMAVSVFPCDGAIPTLIDATDVDTMTPLIEQALAQGGEARKMVDLRIIRGHYGRRNRCVVRYEADLAAEHGRLERRVFYGKVGADDRAERVARGVAALRAAQSRGALRTLAAIPDVLFVDPDLRLALLTEVPGRPTVGALLKRAALGESGAAIELARAVEASARVAASLHGSGIRQGLRRTLDLDLDQLAREVHELASVSPSLGRTLVHYVDAFVSRMRASEALPLRFAHGDFTSTQLLFSDDQCGLVDFDTLCQAEPALDIGQYLAHLQIAARRAARRAGDLTCVPDTLELRSRFLEAYHEASPLVPAAWLRERVALHEGVSLLRLAVHSWQKFKVDRLIDVLAALEEQR